LIGALRARKLAVVREAIKALEAGRFAFLAGIKLLHRNGADWNASIGCSRMTPIRNSLGLDRRCVPSTWRRSWLDGSSGDAARLDNEGRTPVDIAIAAGKAKLVAMMPPG
jgi:hypothetical protein